jgi:hypothetical protein
MTTEHTWIKSSHSGSEGNCVEIAATGDQVLIRDSNDTHGPVLTIPASAWRRFAGQLSVDIR